MEKYYKCDDCKYEFDYDQAIHNLKGKNNETIIHQRI